MADRICAIYCDPPIAFARLGGSTTPLAAYKWATPANPRTDGNTVIVPSWSLNILPDGTVDPFLPNTIRFRDGPMLRPVCPFVEIWARVGDPAANSSTWHDAPLTAALLAAEGLTAAALTFTVSARNLKVQRRTGNPALAYGTFPDVAIAGDDHSLHALAATNPPGVPTPMIPAGQVIPLGVIQVLKSRLQPATTAVKWAEAVNVATIRVRFTPAPGLTYGPRQAASANVQNGPSVQPAQAFLNDAAGWFGNAGAGKGFVIPADTFDTRADNVSASLGVIDDTCEARLTVSLRRNGQPSLAAHANFFSAPPDFAPDRRPIVSIADELNDRAADGAARNAALTHDELDVWVADLFDRIYETVSVLNVDFWRDSNAAFQLPPGKLAPAINNDQISNPRRPMGSEDALRNRDLRVGAATTQTPLPLSDHARERHRGIASIDTLRALVVSDPARLKTLIREPFEAERVSPRIIERLRRTTMRMPPFMAQSTPSTPLTLAAWQYALLMSWATAQQAPAPAAFAVAARAPSPNAIARRTAVLQRLDTAGMVR